MADVPAIIVPYRNRKQHLEVLLDRLPAYLRDHGIERFEIFVSEQVDPSRFGISTSRNVGAAFALVAGTTLDDFVFNNVDIVPFRNVDYGRPSRDTMWFMDAGSAKILPKSFVKVNGYNNAFSGWGYEDTEFWWRFEMFSIPTSTWHQTEEAENAEVLNLEFADLSEEELYRASKQYFGWGDRGPRFVDGGCLAGVARINKNDNGFSEPSVRERNQRLVEGVMRLPSAVARGYFGRFGVNQIDLGRVASERVADHVWWLRYDLNDVLSACNESLQGERTRALAAAARRNARSERATDAWSVARRARARARVVLDTASRGLARRRAG